ncbi:X chromosome NonDisjunction factor [Caenorhabditis elegans]|uniref:X chromosome NonDisjunction factor n=1 Tax=Caenorhabditis elegans TaxID=6239 RepID=O45134_CAEEL|nr:X chromosome NonDisjunction factor [Caenorhabditis elegans]CCD63124.1 X chromosome NonDisjunction factor [Caenorhabditis elegans]|eukprot:NP_498207.1 X chromosome NonDisjunction factor [Caenorhabditis elegans]
MSSEPIVANLDNSMTTEPAPAAFPPISPMSFAFMNEEERAAVKFPKVDPKPQTAKDDEPSTSQKTLSVDDLLIVDDDDETDSPPASSSNYEPKAHIGWASFGDSCLPPPPKPVKKATDPNLPRRKVYVIRSQNTDKSKSPLVVNNQQVTLEKAQNSPKNPNPVVSKPIVLTDSDEDVDVVGFDEEEEAIKIMADPTRPPDLPPQRSLISRFESNRTKRDIFRNSYDSDEEEFLRSRYQRAVTPPPILERQSGSTRESVSEPSEGKILEEDATLGSEHTERVGKRIELEEINPSQLLRTKISASAIPILPLSKSIMERKKVALEMTKNAVIRQANNFRPKAKNSTVAPKSVQIPAYNHKTPMTFYSNMAAPAFVKGVNGRCYRCAEIQKPVDMSSFRFVDDSTVIAIRAHLCDQTRVMVARTAIWNREYAKRLGDRAAGTVWQKPDEVSAQMTGFCSATVRRCIEIANMSIIPKCADRVGVSRNELTSLKSSFGSEKFCGQTMRAPHVLTQFYSVNQASMARNREGSDGPSSSAARPVGRPPTTQPVETAVEKKKNDEDEKRHHPLTNFTTASTSSQNLQDQPPPKNTVLRWSNITTPRILRPPTLKTPYSLPRTAVIPVMKKKQPEIEQVQPKKDTTASLVRKRGRPRKEKPLEVQSPRKGLYLRFKSCTKYIVRTPIDKSVQETVNYLLDEVDKRASTSAT